MQLFITGVFPLVLALLPLCTCYPTPMTSTPSGPMCNWNGQLYEPGDIIEDHECTKTECSHDGFVIIYDFLCHCFYEDRMYMKGETIHRDECLWIYCKSGDTVIHENLCPNTTAYTVYPTKPPRPPMTVPTKIPSPTQITLPLSPPRECKYKGQLYPANSNINNFLFCDWDGKKRFRKDC